MKQSMLMFLVLFLILTLFSSVAESPSEVTTPATENMVYISAGEFLMGSPEGEGYDDEHPRHKIYLDAYYIDKYEVTNEQYAKFLNAYGQDSDDDGNKMIYENEFGLKMQDGKWQPVSGYEKYPVICVTWYGANQYAKYYGKRLPTEAGWEKATRGNQEQKYAWGSEEPDAGGSQRANYNGCKDYDDYEDKNGDERKEAAKKDGYEYTSPVGTYENGKGQYGCYDMAGNVWEWCNDWYDSEYYGKSPEKNPRGPDTGQFKVFRGGSWNNPAKEICCTKRGKLEPNRRYRNIGFRCIRIPKK